MPPLADDTKAAWASNDYVRVTINVLLITGAIFFIKIAVQMIYLLYLRKRHPKDGGARPRTRVGLVFDPTSPDMIPNLEIGMERRDSRGSTQPQGEARNDGAPPSAPADLVNAQGQASNVGGVEPLSGQECCEAPAALRRSVTA